MKLHPAPTTSFPRLAVNYAEGSWYPQGQRRLAGLCHQFNLDIALYDSLPPGSPTHAEAPWCFKLFCLEDAIARTHATKILWMDSSAVPQHPLDPIFAVMEEHGAFISKNYGWKCEQWTMPSTYEALGLDPAVYGPKEHCSALIFGIDLEHPTGAALYADFLAAAKDGARAFKGPTTMPGHKPGGTSLPYGNRGDQSVLSLLAHKHGIPLQPHTFMDYGKERPAAIVAAYPTD